MLPVLQSNQVNVFLSDVYYGINEQLYDYYLSLLNTSELRKYHAFHFEKDKRLYLLAHVVLKLVLSEYLNCSVSLIEFKFNKYGKPALKDPSSSIQFNLSHSQTAVALGVSYNANQDLGVDIEHQDRKGQLLEMASHFFSKAESAILLEQPKERQVETFFKLWTLKEAYIKAIGKGLSIDLDSFSFSSLDEKININHYAKEEHLNRWDFYCASTFKSYQLSIASRIQSKDAKQPGVNTFKYLPVECCVGYPLNFVTSLK